MRRAIGFLLVMVLLGGVCPIAQASDARDYEPLIYTAIYSLKASLKTDGSTAKCKGVVTARINEPCRHCHEAD